MTEQQQQPTKIFSIEINEEYEDERCSVEEMRRYIKHLHTQIPILNKNQEMLWNFGEKMIEMVKTEKEKFRSQNQNFSKLTATHSEILELYQQEQEENEEKDELIKSLTLKCRKLKKKKNEVMEENGDLVLANYTLDKRFDELEEERDELQTGIEELRSRVCDYEWVLKCEEKLKAENAELKEKLKHYLPWYERAKMEEQEETEEN